MYLCICKRAWIEEMGLYKCREGLNRYISVHDNAVLYYICIYIGVSYVRDTNSEREV